jgi:hypothetical protein
MTNKEKSIRIVFGMFMAEYDGDAVEVYNKLSNELADSWDCIDYATVWNKFEDDTISEVVGYMNDSIDAALRILGE